MTPTLIVGGAGALAAGIFAILWLLSKNKVTSLEGQLESTKKDLAATQQNLKDTADAAQQFATKAKNDGDARDQAIADLAKRCEAYRKLLDEKATPEQVAERLGQLFPGGTS